MQTRRDLYQAHRLMVQRVGLALIQGEPDVPESPMRRGSVAAFAGLMVALLVAAVAGVWGLIKHDGATGIENSGQIIIEKETGTKYIWDAKLKRLDPMANYASAVLALASSSNGGAPSEKSVSRESLKKYTRGPELGIPGAPDSLPDKKNLVRAPWSVCVSSGTRTGNLPAEITSLLAGINVGGRVLGGSEGVIVQAGGASWMIWNNQRMQLKVPDGEIQNLNHGENPPQVTQAWLTALKQGQDFKDPDVPGRGAQVNISDGSQRRIGQVFVSTDSSGNKQFYVLTQQGFAAITQAQSGLILDNPVATAAAYPSSTPAPIQLDNSVIVRQQAGSLIDQSLPATLPSIQRWDSNSSGPLCVVYQKTDVGSDAAVLSVGGSVAATQVATNGQGTSVDQVLMPPGKAAVIGQLPGSGLQTAINSWLIVNDQGLKYPVSSKDVVTKLGYDVKNAAPVPAQIVSLIPSGGATLDLTQASCPISQNANCQAAAQSGGNS